MIRSIADKTRLNLDHAAAKAQDVVEEAHSEALAMREGRRVRPPKPVLTTAVVALRRWRARFTEGRRYECSVTDLIAEAETEDQLLSLLRDVNTNLRPSEGTRRKWARAAVARFNALREQSVRV